MPNPTTAINPALLPSPALFDVTTIAAKDVEGTIERIALDRLELAPNARRDISQEGIERLAAMLLPHRSTGPVHRPPRQPRRPGRPLRRPAPPARRQGQPPSSPAATGSRASSRCRA